MLIKTGQAEIVVVEGHCKASNILTLPHIVAYAQDPILNRPLNWETDFVAGLDMNRYLYESGTTLEQCAMVVMKNRRNALRNPLAAYGADLTLEEAMGGDPIAWPLLDRHTARHADGAVVMVLSSEKRAENLSPYPVWVTGVGWCNGAASLESREWGFVPYVRSAAEMAYSQAGIGQPKFDLDFVEIDDIYAFKELQTLEALGICSPGEAGELTEEGGTDVFGELPVNPSGGCLGMGDMLDANGMARALEVVLQLRGEAGMRQLEDVEIGLAQAWRGVPTTSSAVAIFQV
jgi:acetyl-CoA C-acetyltransferase